MDELVQQVVKRTGLTKDTARQAVEAVLEILKEGLPGPNHDHVYLDQLLEEWGQLNRGSNHRAPREEPTPGITSMQTFLRGLRGPPLN